MFSFTKKRLEEHNTTVLKALDLIPRLVRFVNDDGTKRDKMSIHSWDLNDEFRLGSVYADHDCISVGYTVIDKLSNPDPDFEIEMFLSPEQATALRDALTKALRKEIAEAKKLGR